MPADFNWDNERSGIINDTLDTLRDQRDDSQQNDLFGTISFNPQSFTTGKHMVLGPINFETSFSSSPIISLTQQLGTVNASDASNIGLITDYTPFLILPYIHSIQTSSGTVDGFYIGLYAVTVPTAETSHSIHWRATGKASVYKDTTTDEAWTSQYDQNEPSFLVEDAGNDYIDDSPDFSLDPGDGDLNLDDNLGNGG